MRTYGKPPARTIVFENRTSPFIRLLAGLLVLAALSHAAEAQSSLTLTWGASSGRGIIGYRVYQGGASRTYTNITDVGQQTRAVVNGLRVGAHYFFAVTAYNSVGLESPFSTEFSYSVGSTGGSGNGSGPLAGSPASYYGLFYESNQVQQASSGAFLLSTTRGGSYSGYLQMGGQRLAFHGRFDGQGQASNSLPRPGSAPLSLQFQLAGGASSNQLQGTVSADAWQAELGADRQVYSPHSNPAPQRGVYTLLIPGQDQNDPKLPTGHSFGIVRIDAGGQIRVAASLADGSRVTQSAPLSPEGLWGLYAPLYGGQGSIVSWLAFTNRPGDDLNGVLSWVKPAGTGTRDYAAGFAYQCQALGSAYVPPIPARALPLSLTQATMNFAGGDLAVGFANTLAETSSGRLSNTSSNRLSLSFSPATGAFRGSVVDPSSGKSRPFAGAVFQKNQAGYGFLLGNDQSSRVDLSQ